MNQEKFIKFLIPKVKQVSSQSKIKDIKIIPNQREYFLQINRDLFVKNSQNISIQFDNLLKTQG